MSKSKTKTPKETNNKKNNKTDKKPAQNIRQRTFKWLISFMFKLSILLFFILFIYCIYLDSKVRDKFEGQRWQVPIQVYGKVERLTIGQQYSLTKLKQLLEANKYTRVNYVTRPGEFALSKKRVIIYRRAFDFGAGLDKSKKITIDVKQGKITQLFIDNAVVDHVQIDPILLDRILPKSKEDRVLVPLQSVPESLIDTLLLVEDRNFYFHHGVSPLGILRALYHNIKAGRTVQGGSTLTQQLVKNMFLTRKKTLWRKLNEAIMSLLLEYHYSKDQLLEAYINEVYLGQHYANGIYGFGLAAEFYFGKSIQSLNAEQMAMLIAQVKGPSYYDPWRFPKRALARRDLILRLMYEHEIISQHSYETASASPLSIRHKRRVSQHEFPSYIQLVKEELSHYLSDNQQQSGIRVFTGFSVAQQLTLQQTIDKKMPEFEKKSGNDLQVAMVVSDFKTGVISALVGGKKSGYAGFNRALHAKRQIGSLIKPAVYLAALERYERYNLATILDDKRITLSSEEGQNWQPKNYDGKYRGQVLLIDALSHSLNIPTVNLGMQLGVENVAKAIHLLGYQHDIITRPSLLLGALTMSPIEINQLYLAIANRGIAQQSHTIEKIVNANGETLFSFQSESMPVISDQSAYLLDYALTEVTKAGTARSLTWRLKGKTLAGKTGTTNDQRDSWFVGFDEQLLVTTWLGRDDNKPTQLTGSSGALVLFAEFMKNYGVQSRTSTMPARVKPIYFDSQTGSALTRACDNARQLPAINEALIYQNRCPEKPKNSKKKSWLEKLFGG